MKQYQATDDELEQWEEESLNALRDHLDILQAKPKRERPENTEILDIRQAAAKLGVSSKWLYRNYRDIPHVLIPAGKRPRIKFRRTALDEYLTRHEIDWRKP